MSDRAPAGAMALPDAPEICAILTTYNRAHLLPRVLEGLEAQRLTKDRFEIVVIDDGSTDESRAVLQAWAGRLPMRILHQAQSGLAAAKNMGIFLSRAPLLVFLDDDDVADRNLLVGHLAAHLRNPDFNVAVLGHTDLTAEVAALPVMQHVTGAGGQLFSHGWMKPGEMLSFREFWGGRSSCKRSLLIDHGVFNPIFRFGCEDIELAWRLSSVGLRVLYEPSARATMIRGLTFQDFCRRAGRQGRSQWAFAQLHGTQAVRDYCEIDRALSIWPRTGHDFAAILRWAEGLDRMMLARGPHAPPLSGASQAELDEAYSTAFFLCRAKGIADAASLPPILRRAEDLPVARMGFLDWGVQA
jgi:GT2 family glycosyltransferase